jgi:hypothetical protein
MSKSKKIEIVGSRDFADVNTGEISTFNVIKQQEQDSNFDKIWVALIFSAIEEFGSRKMDVLTWLIENRDRGNNTILKTVAEIAKKTGTDKGTVTSTLNILVKHKLAKRKTGIVWLSPDVIFRGGHGKRMNVLIQFNSIPTPPSGEPLYSKPKQLKAAAAESNNLEVKKKKVKIKAEYTKAGAKKNEIRNEHDNGKRENLG